MAEDTWFTTATSSLCTNQIISLPIKVWIHTKLARPSAQIRLNPPFSPQDRSKHLFHPELSFVHTGRIPLLQTVFGPSLLQESALRKIQNHWDFVGAGGRMVQGVTITGNIDSIHPPHSIPYTLYPPKQGTALIDLSVDLSMELSGWLASSLPAPSGSISGAAILRSSLELWLAATTSIVWGHSIGM